MKAVGVAWVLSKHPIKRHGQGYGYGKNQYSEESVHYRISEDMKKQSQRARISSARKSGGRRWVEIFGFNLQRVAATLTGRFKSLSSDSVLDIKQLAAELDEDIARSETQTSEKIEQHRYTGH